MSKNLSYRDAGVDIRAGEQAVKRIKSLAKSTHGPEIMANLGGFGGLFRFDTEKYTNPVLVSSSDGVGTKLKIAFLTGQHDTVGQDLVNHCVNDILTTGAEPLFFLDYFATSRLDGDVFEEVISGFAKACRENGCALIGGETAEMPDFYQPGEYDLSGTIVGVVNEADLLPERGVNKGDLLVGLYSSGLHTNGYSLARRALLHEWTVDSYLEETGSTVGEALLAIHRSYLPPTKGLIKKPWLHGGGHITGGGITGNLQRLLADDQMLAINWDAWDWLPIFHVIQAAGGVAVEEMRKTFNLGIGWVYIIAPENLTDLEGHLSKHSEPFVVIGEVV